MPKVFKVEMSDKQYDSISKQIKEACDGEYVMPKNGVELVLNALFADFVNCMDVADAIGDFIHEGGGLDDVLKLVDED